MSAEMSARGSLRVGMRRTLRSVSLLVCLGMPVAASGQDITPEEHIKNLKSVIAYGGMFTQEGASKVQQQLLDDPDLNAVWNVAGLDANGVSCSTKMKKALSTPDWYYDRVLQSVDIETATAKRLATLYQKIKEMEAPTEEDGFDAIRAVYGGVEAADMKRLEADQREVSQAVRQSVVSVSQSALTGLCKD